MSPARRKARSAITRQPAEAAAARPKAPAWHALIVGLIAVLTYARALSNEYALDDHLIAATSVARAQAPFSTLFDRTYFERYRQDTYRPVATFSSMIGHRVGADPAVAGRLQNALWHGGAAALVNVFAGRMLGPGPALFASLVFAVHPAGSEAPLCVGYREDVMVCFFVLASLLLTLRGGWGPRLGALLAYALALFSKENAVVLPALLVLTRLTVARDATSNVRALARELAGYLVVTVGYLVIRFGVMASPEPFSDPAGGTFAATLVAVPRIFAHYLRLLVAPWPLIVLYAHMFPLGESWVGQLPWLALDVGFIALSVRLARTRPPLGFGLLWFALALTPTLHFVPMRVTAADRFMYLSMVGGAIAMGAILEMAIAAARKRADRAVIWTGASAALLVLLVLTEQRVTVWHDDLSLWKDTLRHNPGAYMGHFVVGAKLAAQGQHPEARREMEAALATCPRESKFGREHACAHYGVSVGFACIQTNDLPAAREAFTQSLEYLNDNVPATVGLGYVELLVGNTDDARRYADRAVQLNAGDGRSPTIANFRELLERTERERSAPVTTALR